jgi:Spy/CpxP family protein refolding chaperone
MLTNLPWNSRISFSAVSATLSKRFVALLPSIAIVFAGATFHPAAFAQLPSQATSPAKSSTQPAARRHGGASIDNQVNGLAKTLNLDQEQQAAIKRILERRQQEMLRIMHSSSGPDGISRLQALQIGTANQIRSVLNDEQKEKYNVLAPHPPQTSSQPSVEDWMKATRPH